MLIGDKIKSIRELKNYTQEYMAYQLGMTQAGYSKIEKGKTRVNVEKLQKLSVILDLPVEAIINFESEHYFSHKQTNQSDNVPNNDTSFALMKRLYEDKISLLEKLLGKTDTELQCYKEKYDCYDL
ncbi:helix-turn-helix domain-containing protein [Flavobacterium hercynium]|uniref:Transcriptional regulator n=1 Tax=Flavobacterium hercynium TaxID=387094 RepID=A0A226GXH6_9FLAO|nr:helix-turn-helix transcriptional regulator [Flavobacterium hercynium]OXA85990.1 transcriptional regulator [Flavobacterium hercynium]SMP37284.1 Transcriptional regulator, contains XRE-family HTH domain [Flavobacterium hercynium]